MTELLFRKATTPTHEIAVSKYERLSDEELLAGFREPEAQIRPMIDLEVIEVRAPLFSRNIRRRA